MTFTSATFIPSEWAAQTTVWVGWPHIRGEWGKAFDGARSEIAGFVRALSEATPVRIACGSREAYTSAWLMLDEVIATGRVQLYTVMTGDIWLRDTGPVISRRDRSITALKFCFNGWGGKFVMPGDTETADAIARIEGLPVHGFPFVIEGGAIDLDGAGRMLTTRQCVLNQNRNSGWTLETAERALREAFGVNQIIWLGDGLLNDHTDGHVDNIARFIGPGRVVCQTASGPGDPNEARLKEIERELRESGLDVHTIPSPGLVSDEEGTPVPASHMNFLISNRRVYLPTYESEYSAEAARGLALALPGYDVITLPARNILSGGGAFHCMTQQVPQFEGVDQ